LNKEDIATIRRQFTLHNEQLDITHLCNVYVQKEAKTMYHYEYEPFEMLESDTKELFLTNFKKTLSGRIDTKLFPLRWDKTANNDMQQMLQTAVKVTERDAWLDTVLKIAAKCTEEKQYDKDTVLTFIQAESRNATKKVDIDDAPVSSVDDVHRFILCSINESTLPETALTFDYIEKQFRANVDVDPIIQLAKPIVGFMFPTITAGFTNVNEVLFYNHKPNVLDDIFVENVLGCKRASTAKDDKTNFEMIVSSVANDQIDSETIHAMYEEIDEIIDENDEEAESIRLDYRDVEQIMKNSGIQQVDSEQLKTAYESIVPEENQTLKAMNLLPKNVSIKTDSVKVTLKREHLDKVTYTTRDGRPRLTIELDEDIQIEGFQIEAIQPHSSS